MKQSGIYQIHNLENDKLYIGGCVNLNKRFSHHVCELNHKRHNNKYLQRDWNRYGQQNFEFVVLELCTRDELLKREQYYLDQLRPQYNISKSAGNNRGTTRSEETRKRMSEARKKLWRSQGYRERVTEANKSTWSDPELRKRASDLSKALVQIPS